MGRTILLFKYGVKVRKKIKKVHRQKAVHLFYLRRFLIVL